MLLLPFLIFSASAIVYMLDGKVGPEEFNFLSTNGKSKLQDIPSHQILEKVFDGKKNSFGYTLQILFYFNNIEILYKAAYEVRKAVGSYYTLYLGRSPRLVGDMVRLMLKLDGNTEAYKKQKFLNFSGSPDVVGFRKGKPEYNKKNVVTPSALMSLFDQFVALGLKDLKSSDKLFIVDGIGSGSSLNSFLRLLQRFYFDNKLKIPDVTFVALNMVKLTAHEEASSPTFEVNHKLLRLLPFEDRNIRHLVVNLVAIGAPEKLSATLIDNDIVQKYCMMAKSYHASEWKTGGFDEFRSSLCALRIRSMLNQYVLENYTVKQMKESPAISQKLMDKAIKYLRLLKDDFHITADYEKETLSRVFDSRKWTPYLSHFYAFIDNTATQSAILKSAHAIVESFGDDNAIYLGAEARLLVTVVQTIFLSLQKKVVKDKHKPLNFSGAPSLSTWEKVNFVNRSALKAFEAKIKSILPSDCKNLRVVTLVGNGSSVAAFLTLLKEIGRLPPKVVIVAMDRKISDGTASKLVKFTTQIELLSMPAEVVSVLSDPMFIKHGTLAKTFYANQWETEPFDADKTCPLADYVKKLLSGLATSSLPK